MGYIMILKRLPVSSINPVDVRKPKYDSGNWCSPRPLYNAGFSLRRATFCWKGRQPRSSSSSTLFFPRLQSLIGIVFDSRTGSSLRITIIVLIRATSGFYFYRMSEANNLARTLEINPALSPVITFNFWRHGHYDEAG